MLKIWSKIYLADKIVKSKLVTFESAHILFFDMIKEICHQLDIATPVILNSHFEDFISFRHCVFASGDFIESINFDKLIIERVVE